MEVHRSALFYTFCMQNVKSFLLCTFYLNKNLSVHFTLRARGPGQRIHTRLSGTTIKAVTIRTPPHVCLSHEGTGGHFAGPDIMMLFIDSSVFHFRCAVLSCNRRIISLKLDRNFQTGSNMAQSHHRWPFCRLVSGELTARHYVLLPTKGVQFFV